MSNLLITEEQRKILELFKQDQFLSANFYFTGGTALSNFYLNHRYSDDLDFFSDSRFDVLEINKIIRKWSDGLNASFDSRLVGETYIYNLYFSNNYSLKIDFAFYPYKRVRESNLIEGIRIDSKEDIATNKFAILSQRTDVKDFVDLYYLLKDFTIIDLMHWAEVKFKREFDLMLFATDLLKVEDFEYMPRMANQLTLQELKDFYLDLAKRIGIETTKA